ncbi:MAG: dockerin type I repeat-containing protein [Planctomycetales bacterium]|nr:dockerin type I repeat-containing protein [Planctomycetales bacterium]
MDVRRRSRLRFRGSSAEQLEARCLLTADTIIYDGALPLFRETAAAIEDSVYDLTIEASGGTRASLNFNVQAVVQHVSVLGSDGAPLSGWTVAETVDGSAHHRRLHVYGRTPTNGDEVTIHFDVEPFGFESMVITCRAEFDGWILDDQSLLADGDHEIELPLSYDATQLHVDFQQAIWAGRETVAANRPWEIYHYDRLSGEKVVTGSAAYNQDPLSIVATEAYPAVELAQNAFVIEYDSATGNLRAHSQTNAPITVIEIRSNSHAFQGERPAAVSRTPFDVFRPHKLFSLFLGGVSSFDFGPVLPTGLTVEELQEDLLVSGAILPRGGPDMSIYSVDGAAPSLARMSGTTPLAKQLANYAYAETVFDNPNQLDLIFDTLIHFSLPSSPTENLPLLEYRFNENEPWQTLGSYGTEERTPYYIRQQLIPAAGHEQVHLRIRTGAAREPFELLKASMRTHEPTVQRVRVWLEVPSKTALQVNLHGENHVYNESGNLVTQAANFAIGNQGENPARYYVEYDASSPNGLASFQYVAIEAVYEPYVPLFVQMNVDSTLYLRWHAVADLTSCQIGNVTWANGEGPNITLLTEQYSQQWYELSAPVPPGHYTLDLGTTACRTTLGTAIPRYLEFDFSDEEILSATVDSWLYETSLWLFASPVGPKTTRQLVARMTAADSEIVWKFEGYVSGNDTTSVVPLPKLRSGMYTLSLDLTDASVENSPIVRKTYVMHVVESEFARSVTLTIPGDVNLDGRFDEYDLALLAAMAYDSEADWEHGDFDGDGRFTTADLAFALQSGWYGAP